MASKRFARWSDEEDCNLIDLWREHECLFNPSTGNYYDKQMKFDHWSDIAARLRRDVRDVQIRAASLRTMYGRLLKSKPGAGGTKDLTVRQRWMLQSLDFLQPYILPRTSRNGIFQDYMIKDISDQEELDLETISLIDSSRDSILSDTDPIDTLPPSTTNIGTSPCPTPKSRSKELLPREAEFEVEDQSGSQPDKGQSNAQNEDVLNQFAKILVSDMRQIKDPIVLMRLRRDLTNAVYNAVQSEVSRISGRSPPYATREYSCGDTSQGSYSAGGVLPPSQYVSSPGVALQRYHGLPTDHGDSEELLCYPSRKRKDHFQKRTEHFTKRRNRFSPFKRRGQAFQDRIERAQKRGVDPDYLEGPPERKKDILAQSVTQGHQLQIEIDQGDVKIEEVTVPV